MEIGLWLGNIQMKQKNLQISASLLSYFIYNLWRWNNV